VNITLTLNTYSHALPDMLLEAVKSTALISCTSQPTWLSIRSMFCLARSSGFANALRESRIC
jgi:hypothetical protein